MNWTVDLSDDKKTSHLPDKGPVFFISAIHLCAINPKVLWKPVRTTLRIR